MSKLWEFTKGAGGWAMASEIASLVFFVLGLIAASSHGASVTSFVMVASSVPLFWIGAFFAWLKLKNELDELKAEPPSLLVVFLETMCRLSKKVMDNKYDLFLRIRVDPLRRADITDFVLSLVLESNTYTPERHDDMSEWRLDVTEGKSVHVFPCPALPMHLEAGVPVEGWLHFLTGSKMRKRDLERSTLRLTCRTASGAITEELTSGAATHWNFFQARDRKIVPKGDPVTVPE